MEKKKQIANSPRLSPIKKLTLRIVYLTTDKTLDALARQFDSTTASISRNTTGKGFTRQHPIEAQYKKLWDCWKSEARNSAGFTESDFGLIYYSALIRLLGGAEELIKSVNAKLTTSRKVGPTTEFKPKPLASALSTKTT